ncbi:50S ribosomal protein L16 [bacterium HR35]|nr:50S ribosomal protein L16 [bacterium HR35]
MLQPRKLKYRKAFKGRSLNRKITTKGHLLAYGEMGLKALETKMVDSREIEAVINELKRRLGKRGRYWLRIFPHKPKTKKPPEVRMGGGKGDVETYVALVRPGTIMFEVSGLPKETLKEILRGVQHKLSVKTKIVSEE